MCWHILTEDETLHVTTTVYKGAGEQNMSAEIQRLLGGVAAFPHLVLHCVHFLHRGVAGITGGCVAGHKIWKVSGNRKRDNFHQSSTSKDKQN